MIDNQQNTNLISRLRARFHSTKIYKAVLGLAVSASILLSAGCGYNPNLPINPNNPDKTNPKQMTKGGTKCTF